MGVDIDITGTLRAQAHSHNPIVCLGNDNGKAAAEENIAPTLTAGNGHCPFIESDGSIVRRLTPVECERLQGFPDGYTQLGDTKDAPRYRALGNSMAVPVMRWIGERIQAVDNLTNHISKETK